jgi:DNA modification methylase
VIVYDEIKDNLNGKTLDIKDVENQIICADVLEGLRIIPDKSVHLIFTSPPYCLDIKYGNHNDNMPWDKYLEWLFEVWSECSRVLVPGGRLVINIDSVTNRQDPLESREYIRPILAELVMQMRRIPGMMYRSEFAWYKHQVVGRATAWGCYDQNTRVMTSRGLKYFKDVNFDDEFVTLNPDTMKIEYQKMSNYLCESYYGDMYRVKSNGFDLFVTPNHNMVLWNNYKKKIEIREMSDCPKSFMIPQGHKGVSIDKDDAAIFVLPTVEYGKRTKKDYIKGSTGICMDDWLKFLGIFLTDGNVDYSESRGSYKVSIYQKKLDYLDDIKLLLDRLPFKFTYKESKYEFYTCDKRLARWLVEWGQKDKRQVPSFIFDLSVRQKNIFVDWLFIGDGHRGDCSYLAVASDDFAFSLSSILTEVGYKFSIHKKKKQKERLYKGKIFKSNLELNIITIKKSNFYHLRESNGNISKVKYDGKIYCVEVPNNILLVERNGFLTWCGNSYMSCSNPTVRRNHEHILVWSKNDWQLPGDQELSDMTDEEFQQWTMSHWYITPETRKMGNHPVPFPPELARRVIKLYSYRGNTVLDPFVGSGTTCSVAASHARKFIGIDNHRPYAEYADRRIAREMIEVIEDRYVPRSQRMKNSKQLKSETVHVMEPKIDFT